MTTERPGGGPLRVAIVGAGPAAFYAAEHLLAQSPPATRVDMFERLPAPFGLVRYGVAPDHAKIKRVTRVYEKTAAREGFRYFGNVEYGTHLRLADLRRHYHAVCFGTGAQTDRRMGIPGEDLAGSHTATAFVAWYNGHPDYRDHAFDLSVRHVVVVGMGNVAVDVARILCRPPAELERTDVADYALEALRRSRVRTVTILGRRGPAQAAFTNAEVKELGELDGVVTVVRPDEAALDPLSAAAVSAHADRALQRKIEIVQGLADRVPPPDARTLTIRFLVSPVELLDRGDGAVGRVRLVRNELQRSADGTLRPKATDAVEELPVDLLFRSVGYRGVPLPELPFDERAAVVPNAAGRVVGADGAPLPGLYVAGWIKRGPSGVIGTNKPCAVETVDRLLEDAAAGRLPPPAAPDDEAIERVLADRGARVVSWDGWKRIDAAELQRGAAAGRPRPRVKLTDPEAMLRAAG